MKAYKGFTKDITSRLGDGVAEHCTFEQGKSMITEESKTARSGFHCCENVFECMSYYPMNGENRFFLVEAEGDINEDAYERIACTKITLLEELNPLKIAYHGMSYMIEHPDRERWEQTHVGVVVRKDEAEAKQPDHIAIARGKNPRVWGVKGSIIGLIREDEQGNIVQAKLMRMPEDLADRWLCLLEDGTVSA
jgi:hypothetical protein